MVDVEISRNSKPKNKYEFGLKVVVALVLLASVLNAFFGWGFFFKTFAEGVGFFGSLTDNKYLFNFFKLLEVITAIVLLTDKFLPFVLVLILPMTLFVFLFHLLFNFYGVHLVSILLVCNIALAWIHRDSYRMTLFGGQEFGLHS